MRGTIETADGKTAWVERVSADIIPLTHLGETLAGDTLAIDNGASHLYVITGDIAAFARNFIDLVPEARTVSQTEYSNLCDVIDRAKNDDRSDDTDAYASGVLAALGLSLEGARA